MKQFLCIAVLACLACARKFRAATEVPSSQKVSDCFDEETARLERQKQQSGPFDFLGDALGFVGGLCPGGGGSSSGRRRRRSLLIQTNESTQLIGPLCAVTAGASMVVDAVNGQIQKAHDAENFAATDCNRMAAEMTLQKLEGLERKLEDGLNDVNSELQNLNGMINNVQGAMQANHAETKRLLQDLADHVEEGKQQMREIEANLDSRMLALGTATATLSAKLDLLSNKVTKSMEQNARAQYNVLLARFSAALAVVRGAYEDVLDAGASSLRQDERLQLVALETTNMDEARLALRQWREDSTSLRTSYRDGLQNSWSRARDALSDLVGVLGNSELLLLHFQLLFQSTAQQHLESNSLASVFGNVNSFVEVLQAQLDADALLPSSLSAVMYTIAVLETYQSVFPNPALYTSLRESLVTFRGQVNAVKAKLQEDTFLQSIAEAPMLAAYRISDSCAVAAFKAGIAEPMAAWEAADVDNDDSNNFLVFPSKLFAGEPGGRVECSLRPTPVHSNVLMAHFDPTPTSDYVTTDEQGYQQAVAANGKQISRLVECNEDYAVHPTQLRVAQVTCLCSAATSTSHHHWSETTIRRKRITWTCTVDATQQATNLFCVLKDGADRKMITRTTEADFTIGSITSPLGSQADGILAAAGTFLEKIASGLELKETVRAPLTLRSGYASRNGFGEAIGELRNGICTVQAVLNGGSSKWQNVATLPSACRPAKRLIFALKSDGATSRVDVTSGGELHWLRQGSSANSHWLGLTGVIFATDGAAGSSQPLALANGWTNFENGYAEASYRVMNDLCMLSGLVRAGDWAKAISTLPNTCRPPTRLIFNLLSSQVDCRVDVYPNGRMKHIAGSKKIWLSLNGITFTTRPGNLLRLGDDMTADVHYKPPSYTTTQGLCIVEGFFRAPSFATHMLIATLPADCWPRQTLTFSTKSQNTLAARLNVLPTGEIKHVEGGAGWMSLNGITFAVAQ